MGHVIAGSRWRWPNGIIPYTISEEDFPPADPAGAAERVEIEAAVTSWNNSANGHVTLRARELGDTDYVEFVAGDDSTSCNSPVGRQGGRQEIECNLLRRVLRHEIGHAVGLFHEHQRDDRDLHVTVLTENVRADKRDNFDKKGDAGDEVGPYDFASVMHYRGGQFAVDWLNGERIPFQRSSTRPALAAFDNELHMVHLGVLPSNDLWHAKWTPGGGWTDDVRIGGQKSWAAPALAVLNNGLHMVHLGSSGSDELWHASFPPGGALGRDWSDDVKISGQKSWAAPALAVFNNALHMVHLGSSGSNELWHASFPPGGALGRDWSDDVKISGQKSGTTPALAVRNQLNMVHLGSTGSHELWHASFPSVALGGSWTDDVKIKDQKSRSVPALCAFGGILHLAYVGDPSTTMWHSTFDGTWATRNRNDNNRPPLGPALAELAGSLHAVFVGDNGRMWHSMRDDSLQTIVPPPGVTLGNSVLSPGDIATVALMYP